MHLLTNVLLYLFIALSDLVPWRMNWGICDGTAKVNKPWLEEAKILLTISKQSLNSMRILPGQWAAP